jgi:hypothetical protein
MVQSTFEYRIQGDVIHTLLYFDDGPLSNEIVSDGIAVINSIGVFRRGISSSTISGSSSAYGGKRKSGTTGTSSGIRTIVVINATTACKRTKVQGLLQCFSLQKPTVAAI